MLDSIDKAYSTTKVSKGEMMARDCSIEELACESQSGGKIVRLSDLQDWLSDKKVIKKGLQPHPYADELHEVAEGLHHSWDTEVYDRATYIDYRFNVRVNKPQEVYEYHGVRQ